MTNKKTPHSTRVANPARLRLRPVEAVPISAVDGPRFGLRDPSGLSDVMITVSGAALQILAMMDGTNTAEEIRELFSRRFGQPLDADTLQTVLDHLEQAHFLEGEPFERFYAEKLRAYRAAPHRAMRDAEGLGIDSSGALFAELLNGSVATETTGRIVGLVAPHLDYPRGGPCYAKAYSTLRGRSVPDRVVILGTNHFGRSRATVVTGKDFATPLGVTPTDVGFIERLEVRCGNLRAFEMDHAKEHSVELQVAWLQYLFGAERFSIVPVLCPDPCGPTGTAPDDGQGVDLHEFAVALGELIAEDPRDTLLVAGADLSHVGASFGDDRELDNEFLQQVRRCDEEALEHYRGRDPRAFVSSIARRDNSTRVCSAGCMYVVGTALSNTTARLLGYHQAVDRESQTCVTCAAVVFVAQDG